MLARIQRARKQVDAIRTALQSISHDDLQNCLPALHDAIACLRTVELELAANQQAYGTPTGTAGAIGKTDPALTSRQAADEVEIRRELQALKIELDHARRLIIHGAAFYEGWARLLGAATAGYTDSGSSAPLIAPGTVSIKG